MVWFGRANTTFGSSADYNGLISAITLSGAASRTFKTCDRCCSSPMCILGSDAVCDGFGSNAQDHNVYFTLTSDQKFISSGLAQIYCNLVSLIVPMSPVDFEEFTQDQSQHLHLNQTVSTGVIVISTTALVNSTYTRNFCYNMGLA